MTAFTSPRANASRTCSRATGSRLPKIQILLMKDTSYLQPLAASDVPYCISQLHNQRLNNQQLNNQRLSRNCPYHTVDEHKQKTKPVSSWTVRALDVHGDACAAHPASVPSSDALHLLYPRAVLLQTTKWEKWKSTRCKARAQTLSPISELTRSHTRRGCGLGAAGNGRNVHFRW